MYEATLLPRCIAIGIDMETFWRLNPRTLKVYYDAHKLKKRMEDEYAWLNGAYVFDAFSTALSNFMRKKGKKPLQYRDKPLLEEAKIDTAVGLSEDEKRKAHEAVFTRLKLMQANFELAHGGKGS